MKSKWNYDQPRQNQSRPKRKRILIVTEGKVTEPLYFNSLKNIVRFLKANWTSISNLRQITMEILRKEL